VLSYLAIAVGSVTHRDLSFEKPVKLPFLNEDLAGRSRPGVTLDDRYTGGKIHHERRVEKSIEARPNLTGGRLCHRRMSRFPICILRSCRVSMTSSFVTLTTPG
jgi:hypothetical protein